MSLDRHRTLPVIFTGFGNRPDDRNRQTVLTDVDNVFASVLAEINFSCVTVFVILITLSKSLFDIRVF